MGLERAPEGKPGKSELETCPRCSGTGKSGTETCGRCKGSGKIPSARR
jgi:DnaJ-class molecular chaperone